MAVTKEMIKDLMQENININSIEDKVVDMSTYSSLSPSERQFVNIYLLIDTYIMYFEPIRSGIAGIDDSSARKLLKTLLVDFSKSNVKRILSAIAYGKATAYMHMDEMFDMPKEGHVSDEVAFCEDIIRIFISTDDIVRVNDKSEIYNLFADVCQIATGLPRASVDHCIIDVCTDFLADDDFPKE